MAVSTAFVSAWWGSSAGLCVLFCGGDLAFVIRLIPTLGIEVLMIVRLLQVLYPVDVHQDGLGLWGCSELQVYLPHHVCDGVDALPLLDELPICRSWCCIEVDQTSVPDCEFPHLGFQVAMCSRAALYAVPSLAAASGIYPSL